MKYLIELLIIIFFPVCVLLPPLPAQTFSLSRAHATFQGKNGMEYFGFATTCGDVNGDGFSDVLVGAYNALRRDDVPAGAVYLYTGRGVLLGKIGRAQANGVFAGKKAFDEAGYALAAGDVNGDGFGDVVIGAPGARKSAGEVYVVMGNSALLGEMSLEVVSMNLEGTDSGDRAGSALTIGDINQDGYRDIIVGAPGAADGAGEVYVFFGGGGSFLSGTRNCGGADVIFLGSNPDDAAGTALAVGDMNGDGIADLCIGAPFRNHDAGSVYIVFGRSGLRGTFDLSGADVTLEGKAEGDQAGSALACGDVNGDEFDDTIIGAPMASPGGAENSGEVYVMFGGDMMPHRQTLAFANVSLQGVNEHDQAGIAVAAADLNHDRYKEIVVGANLAKNGDKKVGEVYFYRGRRNIHGNYNLMFSMLRFVGKSEGSEAGYSISTGDFNFDGIEDIVIGSYGVPVKGLPAVGEAYLIYGLGL